MISSEKTTKIIFDSNSTLVQSDGTDVATPPDSCKPKYKNSSNRFIFSSFTSLPRIVVLRIVLVMSLIIAAMLCAVISYTMTRDLELKVGINTYESIALLGLEGAQANIRRKLQGAAVMAQAMSFAFPDAARWPFVSLNGYTEINGKLADMSASTEHALLVVVSPEQVEQFENFTKQMYADNGFPDYTGTSDFGYGIWKTDPNSPYEDGRNKDSTGETTFESNYRVLIPVVHVAHKASSFLLYNVHSNEFFGRATDSIFKCVEDAAVVNSTSIPSCTVMTDMTEMIHRTGPAGIIYTPIVPQNEPSTVVGMIATTVFWEDILKNIVPDYVDGLVAIISTETQTYTFEIQSGIPKLLASGDLHDATFESYSRSTALKYLETAATSATYSLKVFPSEIMFGEFQTKSPLAVSIGFVGVIVICTLIFLLYDFLMRFEVHHRGVILEMKRRFVRFISHEIRTPLNTVCMGLELLESELCTTNGIDKTTTDRSDKEADEVDEDFCYQVTKDIGENARCAVDILNDILNYDKIETGTLKLEVTAVPIWSLLNRTANSFQIQATSRKINLSLTFQPCHDTIDLEATDCAVGDTYVIGDDVRLGQVLRNVISNALKFTPPDGNIQISAMHIPDGLHNAQPIKIDGSGAPYCSTKRHLRAGSIRIKIKDNGVGMSSGQLGLLFSEGVQFDANKLQHGGGSGLGLAISKGIVEQHCGTIMAKSDGPGHGVEFVVELPLYQFPGNCNENEDGASAPDNATMNHYSTETFRQQQLDRPQSKQKPLQMQQPPQRRVLVVEDVHSSSKMLIRLLERSGHTCGTAANGEMAIRAIVEDMAATNSAHAPFDTILMDFEMPVMDGPQATEEIRKIGFKSTIFGVTGNMLQEDVDYFMSKGANDVLPKPISMKILNKAWEAHPLTS